MEKTFYQDLIEAQKEIEGVGKDGKNPFFKSDYTTLNSTILACKDILNKHNIAVLQPIESNENGVFVCTTLYHTSGESITSKMAIVPSKDKDPQAQGSAITYARRYSLKSMLCMSDADDDAETAMMRNASMYQVTEIKKLFALLKITPEVQTQILAKANAKKVEDLSTSRADFLIKSLRERRDK
jgi:hypothetical protein